MMRDVGNVCLRNRVRYLSSAFTASTFLSSGISEICWVLNLYYKCGCVTFFITESHGAGWNYCRQLLVALIAFRKSATHASSGDHKCSRYYSMQQILSRTLLCTVLNTKRVMYPVQLTVICILKWKKRVMNVVCTASEWRPFSELFTSIFLFMSAYSSS